MYVNSINVFIYKSINLIRILKFLKKRPKITQNKDFEKPKISYFGPFSLFWALAQNNWAC